MYSIFKRSFDVISSLIAMIITSPIWLLIILGIKASSPGPVFHQSIRLGKNYKPFPMIKFRSMHVRKPNQNGRDGCIANAERMFALGSFLRKSKLDELPQLYNVLIGQMSIVGPRPYPEATVKKYYYGRYENILTVKPGLSCLDSLFDYAHGELFVKDQQEYYEKVLPVRSELAEMYIEKKGIRTDLYCIFKTVGLITEIVLLHKKHFEYTGFELIAIDRVKKHQVM